MEVYTSNNHSHNKTTSSFSYTVNMTKYSAAYVSDHLYRKTTFVLQLFYVLLA